jgi:hypothetical protein
MSHMIIKLFSQIINDKTLSIFFNKEIISKLVMYKSWNNEKFRILIISMIKFLQNSDKFKQINSTCNESKVLKSLCDHECIREDVQNQLKLLFK